MKCIHEGTALTIYRIAEPLDGTSRVSALVTLEEGGLLWFFGVHSINRVP